MAKTVSVELKVLREDMHTVGGYTVRSYEGVEVEGFTAEQNKHLNDCLTPELKHALLDLQKKPAPVLHLLRA